MRIPCPFCGDRDSREFVCRGEALPSPDASSAEFLYPRDNPASWLNEHWYHASGCRQWLLVRRDTRTHAIDRAVLAAERGA